MTVSEMMKQAELEVQAAGDHLDTEVTGGYSGDLISTGLANARRKGIRLGRPSILAKVSGKIHILKENGLSNRAIARQVGVGEATVRRALNME